MLHIELKTLQVFSLNPNSLEVNVNIFSCTMSEFKLNGMFMLL
jgi:hypothetical protein